MSELLLWKECTKGCRRGRTGVQGHQRVGRELTWKDRLRDVRWRREEMQVRSQGVVQNWESRRSRALIWEQVATCGTGSTLTKECGSSVP